MELMLAVKLGGLKVDEMEMALVSSMAVVREDEWLVWDMFLLEIEQSSK